MTVSLSMIVKNEAANLEACLEPMRDLVDEIVVVDTGSTDDTRAIAQRLGARVFEFPWCDNFAAARNCALEHATCDWIFILDADDRVVPPEREKLRKLFASLDDRNVGWMMGGVCLGPDGGVSTEVEQVRLFRRLPGIRWKYRVHEQVIPSIEQTGGVFVPTGIRLVHVGYRDPGAVDDKIARNLRLVELDCEDSPFDPFPMFYRGVMLSEFGRHAEAIVALEMCRANVVAGSAMSRALSYGLARAQRADGDLLGALETVRAVRQANPDDAALACLEAEIHIVTDNLEAASAALVDLATREQRDMTTQDLRLRVLFAEILLVLGCHQAAEDASRAMIRARPGFGLPWLVLTDALLAQGKTQDLDPILESLAKIRGAGAAITVVRAARLAHAGAIEDALAEIIDARSARPTEPALVALEARLRAQSELPLASCLGLPWTERKESPNAHVHSARLRNDSWDGELHDHPKRVWMAGPDAVSGFGLLGRHT